MRVAILGTGLIGSSVGLAARAAGFSTVGWDVDPRAVEAAFAAGALDAAAENASEVTSQADTVVVAAPVEATVALLERFPPAAKASLIMDVASVKVPIVAAAGSLPSFVATHPLAGSERSGPGAARADLFEGKTWAYVPPGDAALEDRALAFIAALGGRPLATTAAAHDAIVAFTSHLPQVVSSALGSMLAERSGDPSVVALCGGGMRSMTRLAASDWSMWRGILAANSRAVAQEVRTLLGILRSVAETLEVGDESPLAPLFTQAARGAAELDRTTAPPPSFLASTHLPGTQNDK